MKGKDARTEAVTSEERITPSFRPQQVEKAAPCQGGCANCGDIRGWIGTVAQRDKIGISREEAYARAWQIISLARVARIDD